MEHRRLYEIKIETLEKENESLKTPSVRARPWHVGAPGLSRLSPRLRKLLKRLRAMGGTLAPASVPPYGKRGTVRWYFQKHFTT